MACDLTSVPNYNITGVWHVEFVKFSVVFSTRNEIRLHNFHYVRGLGSGLDLKMHQGPSLTKQTCSNSWLHYASSYCVWYQYIKQGYF